VARIHALAGNRADRQVRERMEAEVCTEE
jgi:hypothetical protein